MNEQLAVHGARGAEVGTGIGAAGMLAALLRPGIAVVEQLGEPTDAPLMAGEEQAVARAVPTRRLEFASTRHCARQALAALGLPPVAIPVGAGREPCWPPGVVGSLTHCAGYRAAAVAPETSAGSIGIDGEPHEPLPVGVLRYVTTADDRVELARLAEQHPDVHWDKLLFSAKESVYKAWFPLTGRWLGFGDATLTFDVPSGTFAARLLVPGTRLDGHPPLTGLTGRWLVDCGLVVTAVVVGPATQPQDVPDHGPERG
ncbi:4'-phosphopantetheinyl transferase family protein [Micromonospora haikouensis]|uniref:4'-phosphopantetheinyl transferase family protein n=1 Tax=Micromonospora haikouensis TaxID=686309 RepID=UPI003D707922